MFTPCFPPLHERIGDAELRFEHVAPGVVSARIDGYGAEDVALRITGCATAVYARDGRYHAFHDWTGLSGYASGARSVLTAWGRAHPGARVSILFQSKLIAMGVSVASMAMSSLASFSERTEFERARDAAIAAALSRR